MKIGLQASTFEGRRTGINNYCYNLVSALAEVDPELEFLSAGLFGWERISISEIPSESKLETNTNGISSQQISGQIIGRLKELESVRALHSYFRELVFSRVYRSRDISLFHAFNYVPPADPAVPTLPVVYDLSFIRYPDMHPKERLRRLSSLQKYVEQAPLVHTISEFSKREIVEVYGIDPDRIFVAYPAAAVHFRPLGRDKTNIDLKAFDLEFGQYFLAVGTLEPRKNLKTLIAAYADLLPSDRRHFPLVIVGGKGWGEIDFPAVTDALVTEGSLRMIGYAPDAVLRSLYEGTRLMLYPSIYEGFGMPVVEAMACGAPVAHSVDTSMDEIAGELAIAVPALDVRGWTACLKQSVSTSKPDYATRNALIIRASTFDWRKGAQLVADAYRQMSSF